MKKRINVTGDIESRRRISQRSIPQQVEPEKRTHDGREEKEEAEETPHKESKERKPRTRKAEGDA